MDVASHAFLGALVGEIATGSGPAARGTHRRAVLWAAACGAAPGILQLLLNAGGVPRLIAPAQSFVVWLAVVVPLCRAFGLPGGASFSWFLQLLVDIVLGHGEAATAPLWPLPWRTTGPLESGHWSWAGTTGAILATAWGWWRVRGVLNRRRNNARQPVP